MKERIYKKLSILDLPLLMQINVPFSICEENAKEFLNNPTNWIFACIQDNKIIGYAVGYEHNNFYNSDKSLYIHAMFVNQPYRWQGIGTGIITGIKETCKLLGIYEFFLITFKSNIAACGLYEKSGGKLYPTSKDDDRAYFFDTLD